MAGYPLTVDKTTVSALSGPGTGTLSVEREWGVQRVVRQRARDIHIYLLGEEFTGHTEQRLRHCDADFPNAEQPSSEGIGRQGQNQR